MPCEEDLRHRDRNHSYLNLSLSSSPSPPPPPRPFGPAEWAGVWAVLAVVAAAGLSCCCCFCKLSWLGSIPRQVSLGVAGRSLLARCVRSLDDDDRHCGTVRTSRGVCLGGSVCVCSCLCSCLCFFCGCACMCACLRMCVQVDLKVFFNEMFTCSDVTTIFRDHGLLL